MSSPIQNFAVATEAVSFNGSLRKRSLSDDATSHAPHTSHAEFKISQKSTTTVPVSNGLYGASASLTDLTSPLTRSATDTFMAKNSSDNTKVFKCATSRPCLSAPDSLLPDGNDDVESITEVSQRCFLVSSGFPKASGRCIESERDTWCRVNGSTEITLGQNFVGYDGTSSDGGRCPTSDGMCHDSTGLPSKSYLKGVCTQVDVESASDRNGAQNDSRSPSFSCIHDHPLAAVVGVAADSPIDNATADPSLILARSKPRADALLNSSMTALTVNCCTTRAALAGFSTTSISNVGSGNSLPKSAVRPYSRGTEQESEQSLIVSDAPAIHTASVELLAPTRVNQAAAGDCEPFLDKRVSILASDESALTLPGFDAAEETAAEDCRHDRSRSKNFCRRPSQYSCMPIGLQEPSRESVDGYDCTAGTLSTDAVCIKGASNLGQLVRRSVASGSPTSVHTANAFADPSIKTSTWPISVDMCSIAERMKSIVSACFFALRPWSLHISLEPVALGAALAYRLGSGFSPVTFFASAITALCVHSAGNVVNSYFDYAKGIDSPSISGNSTALSLDGLVRLGALLYAAGLVVFLFQYAQATDGRLLALVFFGGMSCSFLYTGGPAGFKYIGLGDLVVMLTFGPVSVLYSFLCQRSALPPLQMLSFKEFVAVLLYAAPLALNSEAIIHANNVRDRVHDQRAGVVTLAVALGPHLSQLVFALLLFVPYVAFAVVAFSKRLPAIALPLITLHTAFQLERECRSGDLAELDRRTARLNAYFSVFYVLAIALSHRLPGFGV